MRLWAERDNTEIVGVENITEMEAAWKLKKPAVFAIMDNLCNLIKDEGKDSFFCLYWAMKTYGMICMNFKDLEEARNVFRTLKHECQEK